MIAQFSNALINSGNNKMINGASFLDYWQESNKIFRFETGQIANTPDRPNGLKNGGFFINIHTAGTTTAIHQIIISITNEFYSRFIYWSSGNIVSTQWKSLYETEFAELAIVKSFILDNIAFNKNNINLKNTDHISNAYYINDPDFIPDDYPFGDPTFQSAADPGGTIITLNGCGGNADHKLQILFDINRKRAAYRLLLNTGNQYGDWIEFTQYRSSIRYYALGDSITQGSYSYIDNNDNIQAVVDSGKGYPNWISFINRYASLTNLGSSGAGWRQDYAGNTVNTCLNIVNNNNFANCDLLTIMPYVNDSNRTPLGTVDDDISDETIAGTFKWAINKIISDNPKIMIFVIATPARISDQSKQNLNQLIKNISASYAIPFIDLQNENCVCSLGRDNQFPDGTHPSVEQYGIMGKYLASKLPK